MKNKMSLKKTIISSLFNAPFVDAFEGNKVTLVTALGVISGYPSVLDQKIEKLNVSNAIQALVEVAVDKYKSNADAELSENDGYLLLTDATIKTSSTSVFSFQSLVVFYDQIIAATLGSMD